MQRKKNRLLFILAAFAIAILIIAKMTAPKWISIYETEYCSNLKNETITEITMRQTTDSAVEVVFSDEDLINEWTAVLNSMEVKFDWKNTYFPKITIGGQPLLKVQTNERSYTFTFNTTPDGLLIKIGKQRYVIKEPENVQFQQKYEAAVERYGTTPVHGN